MLLLSNLSINITITLFPVIYTVIYYYYLLLRIPLSLLQTNMHRKKRVSKFLNDSSPHRPKNHWQMVSLLNTHMQFASIKLKHCIVTCTTVEEIEPENPEMRFTCLKFCKPIPGTLKVDFVFVVTYNHELFLEVHAHLLEAILLNFHINFSFCNQIIRKEYSDYLEDRQNQMLDFDSDTIVLDIPTAGAQVDGWKILPLTSPQVLIGRA